MFLLQTILVFLLGLALLVFFSNLLIKSSIKLAFFLKLSTLFIGLIFIAFGTSCPEAAVSITAAVRRYKDIALGNILGSNIANIGLVLGLCGLVQPLKIEFSVIRKEITIMLISCLVLFVFCWDGVLSRLEGSFFILGFIFFCFFSYRSSKKHKEEPGFDLSGSLTRFNSRPKTIALFLISLVFIVLGANLMVNSGVSIAKFFKISPFIIALTVFSIGTSLPELAASLTAISKKVPHISIGNVIGSNVFNILLVLGIVSLIRPLEINPQVLKFELPALCVFSFLTFLFIRSKNILSRLEAGILFFGYIGFIVLLFCR